MLNLFVLIFETTNKQKHNLGLAMGEHSIQKYVSTPSQPVCCWYSQLVRR